MRKINQIIQAISLVYGVPVEELTKRKHTNGRRMMRMRMFCYFSVKAMRSGESTASLRDIRLLSDCPVNVILDAYEMTRDGVEKQLKVTNLVKAIQLQIDIVAEQEMSNEREAVLS